MSDPVLALSARLRDDIKRAMRARQQDETRVLRTLLGAIDNAQAVPLGPGHKASDMRRFGDPSVEVPRRVLTAGDIAALLAHEAESREAVAREMDALNQPERAAALRAEAAIVQRYRAGTAAS